MLDEWLATFAFSRTVRHAPRDFSDAVLLAELLAQALPAGAVALHNYPSTGRLQQKMVNWELLNRKVLTPMRCELSRFDIEELANATPGAIVRLLVRVKQTFEKGRYSPRHSLERLESPSKKDRKNQTATQPVSRPTASPTRVVRKYSSGAYSGTGATTKRIVSNSRSTPPSPSKVSSFRSSASPRYSLTDYLPLSSERPTQDDRSTTFARVLRMTEARQSSIITAPRSPKRLIDTGRPSSPHPISSDRNCDAFKKERKTISIRSSLTPTSLPNNDTTCIPASIGTASGEAMKDSSQSYEFTEGAFVRFGLMTNTSTDNATHLARVVKNLPSGNCLIQLFKASPERPGTPSAVNRANEFVSTPYFIEQSNSQLRIVSGATFDPTRSVWTFTGEQRNASSNIVKPARPSRDFTTTVLARHKLSRVKMEAPLEVRAIETGMSLADHLSVDPQGEEEHELHLYPPPTVFPRVQVDLSVVLNTLPTNTYLPTKKTCQ